MTDSQRWFTTFILLGVTGLIYLLAPVLTPFLIAALIAYLFNPWVDKLTSWKLPRVLSVAVVFLVIIAVVFFLFFLIIPILEKQVVIFVKRIPDINLWLTNVVWPWVDKHFHIKDQIDLNQLKIFLLEHINTGGSILTKTWAMASRSGTAIIEFVTGLVLIPVLSFYLLCDWPRIIQSIKQLLPRRSEKKLVQLVKDCGEVLAAFFRGQLLVMLALGSLYGIGLWAIGLDVGLLIGLMAGLLNIVPYLGFISGLILATIASLVQFHSWIHLIWVLGVFVVGSLTEGFVLTPWFVGDRVGLHPLIVIFAILAFGRLFGFVGVLLAVPVSAVSMVFLRHFHGRYLKSRYYNREKIEK
ncbi:MAG: AI-2E family transporter [Gammaproteobacteria bacterium]|nr:AI-2E family transporter [Gammaproteobacteria bacterium]